MPLGAFPLGIGPTGHDPVADAALRAADQGPLGVFFDARTRDALLRTDGTFEATHPVDQRVVLALTLAKGGVKSAPTAGQTFTAIEYLGPTLEARVRDAIRVALKPITDARDINVIGLRVERVEGGFVFEIDYQNLRIAGSPPRTLTVS